MTAVCGWRSRIRHASQTPSLSAMHASNNAMLLGSRSMALKASSAVAASSTLYPNESIHDTMSCRSA